MLIASNVRWAFNSLALYQDGFARYRVAESTGLSDGELREVARQIRDYFNSREEWLDVRVTRAGFSLHLYNDREVRHMRDVKGLVRALYRVQEGALLYLAVFVVAGLFARGRPFAQRLRRLALAGSTLTAGLVVGVGLVTVVAFGPLFRLFHEVSFRNDLWQLDPATSYLVRMFPFGFWLQATLVIGGAALVEAGAMAGAVWGAQWWRQWRRRVVRHKAPERAP
ncbi:MAG: DUF1461 domain-containing protein [Chloroflexi bacterium]|nr:DUF1461 domain-containing protein [Chloroflexota bacterium]